MKFIHEVKSPRVIFHKDSINTIAEELDAIGSKRVLLVFDISFSEIADRIETLLGSRFAAKIAGVKMHVPDDFSQPIVENVKNHNIDTVLTLGGGSATGLGKILALELDINLVVIPTTYAGSEMTPIWGRTTNNEKLTGRDARVLPKLVFYDSSLIANIPTIIAINSGMNAIAHAIEALYSPNVSPIVEMAALKSIEIFNRFLREAANGKKSEEVAENLLYATMLAGFSLGNAIMGIHHKVCHVLGGMFDLPHAQMHSAVLPYSVAYNENVAKRAMESVAEIFGTPKASQGIWDLSKAIGAEQALKRIINGYN